MRRAAAPVLFALALSGCVAPGSPGIEEAASPGGGLVPTYSPIATPTPLATVGATDAAPQALPDATPGTGHDASFDPTAAPPTDRETPTASGGPADETGGLERDRTPLRASVDDATGDATPSTEPPPDHADLVGSDVIRDANGFTIRHQVDGGAPERTDEDHTMNIATFFDLDGDGDVDYHVWANLSASGWGSAYFDERSGRARYADEDDVEVGLDDGVVVVRFPHGHLDDARSFRWSVGSEWGRYEVIGTDAAARDSAPEDHGSVPFPE